MRRVLLLTLLAAAAGAALAVSGTARGPGGGSPAPASFRLADGSAACAFDGDRLACRTASMNAAVVLEPGGRSRVVRARFGWDASTPTLRPTESWWHAGFTCRVVVRDVVCEHTGASIAVGPGRGAASSASATLP